MNRLDRDSLHTLLSAVVDGSATEEQGAELARRLAADAEARQFYIRYVDMHAALTGGQLPRFSMRPSRMPWIAIAASLMAASVLGAWLVTSPDEPEGRRKVGEAQGTEFGGVTPAGYVATVASASADAIINDEPARAGARLTPGGYTISAGAVNVQFDGGSQILFEGQSSFTLRSRRAIFIDQSTFVFRGDQTCESIEVVTPHSVFRNIGTRYAAIVGLRGEELHVAEGAVRRTTVGEGESSHRELVEAGDGRRYRSHDSQAESIPLDEALALRVLEDTLPAGDSEAKSPAPKALVADDFQTDVAQLDKAKSGFGWSGGWECPRGGLQLVSPGLTGQDSVAVVHDGSGKPAEERRGAAHRRLRETIDLSKDGLWYLRFLVRRGPVISKDEHRAMVVLRTRGLTTQEEIDRNSLVQIAIRKDDTALLRVAGTLTRSSLPLVPGQTYAVIAKIVAGRSQPDQVLVSLMAAERLQDATEPTEWSLVSESVQSDLVLEKLSLEFQSRGVIAVGDLSIGPTWSSVTQPLDP